MTLTQLNRYVTLQQVTMPDGDLVRAAKVAGERRQAVVDTLLGPADMAPLGSTDLVLYTHADWDHCWGTKAFPHALVIGHARTCERVLGPAEAETFARMTAASPERFAGAALVPPELTFTDRLTIDLGGLTLCLEAMPGHTADSVWTYMPELELVLAGDSLEEPILSLNEPGHLRDWAAALQRWSRACVQQVVPSHGQVSGPELIRRNLAYLEELLGAVEQGLARGLAVAELQALLPIERFLPHPERYPEYYRKTHPENVRTAYTELEAK
jgi:glyoxylase-like metal-dependent hydrolase (beta-lactamase superfamily II)